MWSCTQYLCECVHSVLYQSNRQIYNPADLSLSRDVIICPPILMLCMCQCYYLGQVNGAGGPKVKVYFHEKVEIYKDCVENPNTPDLPFLTSFCPKRLGDVCLCSNHTNSSFRHRILQIDKSHAQIQKVLGLCSDHTNSNS